MFAALLDTCVLWPSRQRDFLLSLAVVNLYRPLWSSAILDELRYCEIDKHIGRHGLPQDEAEARAARLVEQMRTHFDDAEVQTRRSARQYNVEIDRATDAHELFGGRRRYDGLTGPR